MDPTVRMEIEKRRKRKKEMFRNCLQALLQEVRVQMTVIQMMIRNTENGGVNKNSWGGRVRGSKNLVRPENNLRRLYLDESCCYPPEIFRRLFGIPRVMYQRIRADLLTYKPQNWATLRCGFGRNGIPTDSKLLASLLRLTFSASFDYMDHICFMSEESAVVYFRKFCEDICEIYGERFLNRRPT